MTNFVDFYVLSILSFVNCTVLSVAIKYLHFPKEMNKVSTYLLTCLAVTVCYVLFKVWQGNGSKGRLMVASKQVLWKLPVHTTYDCFCYINYFRIIDGQVDCHCICKRISIHSQMSIKTPIA